MTTVELPFKRTQNFDDVLRVLYRRGESYAKAISETTGISLSTVSTALFRLGYTGMADDWYANPGRYFGGRRHYYRITPKGRALAEALGTV